MAIQRLQDHARAYTKEVFRLHTEPDIEGKREFVFGARDVMKNDMITVKGRTWQVFWLASLTIVALAITGAATGNVNEYLGNLLADKSFRLGGGAAAIVSLSYIIIPSCVFEAGSFDEDDSPAFDRMEETKKELRAARNPLPQLPERKRETRSN